MSNKKPSNSYTFKHLWFDVWSTSIEHAKDKKSRCIWGSCPLDKGEGIAFSYSGETLFSPAALSKEVNEHGANVAIEIAIIDRIIRLDAENMASR